MMVERVAFAALKVRKGKPMEKRDEFIIPEEISEWINLKKSEYLSELIQLQRRDDFGFEEFHSYDEFIPGTVETPDKAFESVIDKQKVRTYVRTYKDKLFFHQIVIGTVIDDKASKSSVFVPIISFVTRHDELAREFCKGEVISRPTLN